MLPGRVYAWNTFFLQKLVIIPDSSICSINTQLEACAALHALRIPISENSQHVSSAASVPGSVLKSVLWLSSLFKWGKLGSETE